MQKSFCLILMSLVLASCASTGTNPSSPSVTEVKSSAYTMKSGGVVPPSQQGLSVKHADLHFDIVPSSKTLIGKSTLTLHSAKQRDSFSFDLDRVFSIKSIAVNGKPVAQADYSNPEGMVLVNQPVSGDFKVTIEYQGTPREAVKAPWDGGFVWSKTPEGADWIATADQGEGCDLFWPCIDHPFGEPEVADIYITVPAPLMAVANGLLVDKQISDTKNTYHWQTHNVNTYGVALNIGPYETLEDTFHSVYGNQYPIVYYHLPGHPQKAKKLFEEVPVMLNFFERMIGPYPFTDEKAGFVETPHLGMEHQTINAYGNDYRKDAYGFDWLMQHEFAHEWFANQLTADNSDHMWLQEGLGSYMQPLFTQYLQGDMAYKARLFDQRKALDNDFPMVRNKLLAVEEVFEKDQGPGGDVYTKGSLMLHSLRQLMGDEAFFKTIRIVTYGTADPQPGQFKPVLSNSEEFINVANQVSGQDLGWFFDVYLYSAKLPKLNVERTDSQVALSWEAPNGLDFPMPLEVQINQTVHKLDMHTSQTLAVKPKDVVIIDPQSKVLRYDQAIEDFQAFKKEQADKKDGHKH